MFCSHMRLLFLRKRIVSVQSLRQELRIVVKGTKHYPRHLAFTHWYQYESENTSVKPVCVFFFLNETPFTQKGAFSLCIVVMFRSCELSWPTLCIPHSTDIHTRCAGSCTTTMLHSKFMDWYYRCQLSRPIPLTQVAQIVSPSWQFVEIAQKWKC